MSDALHDIPDEVMAMIRPSLPPTPAMLSAIGLAIAGKRDEAVSHRKSSGIETCWLECEEAYIGIDDANRSEFVGAKWAKPMSMAGPITTKMPARAPDHRSTVYYRLTARYVDAGAAKLAEILLPADDKAFSFSEMPVPALIKAKDDRSQVIHSGLGVPLTRPAQAGELPADATPAVAPAAPAAPPPIAAIPAASGQPVPAAAPIPGAPAAPPMPAGHVPLTVRDLALENIEIASKSAKAAETRIYDWMVDSHYTAHMRVVIADSARLGAGILKGPVPKIKTAVVVRKPKGGMEVGIKKSTVPSYKRVDPWNCFPDPTCGENIHDGEFFFERDFMSASQVRKLKDDPSYISDKIDQVLEEGPDKSFKSDNRPGDKDHNKGRYVIWYFYGTLKREDMNAIQMATGKSADLSGDAADTINVLVTLINDSAVKATVNPLDSGEYPYHTVPWQRRDGSWAGIGVAEQLRAPQRIINASLRAMLNNAGKSAGSQIVVDRTAIEPADGSWLVTPDKVWWSLPDHQGNDVRNAFQTYNIPNVTEQMLKIIELGQQLAEESCSIPLITQGQSGPTTPDTFGAAQLQNNNANQLLRSIGYAFDDCITEPVVRQSYEWLLLDPDVPDEEKDNWTIDAHGSIALVERAIQDQFLAQLSALVVNPAFGLDPKKWMTVTLRSKKIKPSDVQYSEDQQAKIDAAPPPEAPAVTVAKIVQDTALKQLAASQTTDQQSLASEERVAAAANTLEGGHVQNDAARVQAERERTAVEQTVKLHELAERRDVAMLDYANKHQITLAQAKVELAKTAMQLQTERDLNMANNAAGDRKHRREMIQRNMPKPPVQVPGRAGNGHGFDQSAGP